MAKDKKGFLLYADQKALFDKLPNDKAGELIKHIFAYVNDENPTTDDLLVDVAFEPIKTQLKRDLEQYEKTRKARSEAGKKGGRPKQGKAKKANALFDKQIKAKKPDSVNDNVIDKDINISFDTFWDLYNKKVGDKTKLIKKWESLKPKEREEIIAYLPAYIESTPDKKFRKNPSTFLNNQSWKDEILTDGTTEGHKKACSWPRICNRARPSQLHRNGSLYNQRKTR